MKKQILILGFILSPLAINSQVYKTIQVDTPGTLGDLLTAEEKITITDMTVTGVIDSMDFLTMRDQMPEIRVLDLSGASTVNNALYTLALSDKNLLVSILLPHSITRIGQESLMSTSITGIIIPPTVTLIEHAPFRYCPLNEVTIPASVKSIGSTVFSPCYSLKSIYVEEGNTAYCDIDGVLFSRDTSILWACPPARKGNYTIPANVEEIGYEGFASCRWIDTLYIPASVKKTGTFSFFDCDSLKKINVDESSTFMTDMDGVLYTKDLSVLIRYPIGKADTSYNILFGTRIIGTGAFERCELIKHITFPKTLVKIESSAFRYAEGITALELPPSLEEIENAAFFYCRSLEKIRIPSSVNSIENLFLNGDSALDTITLNSSQPITMFSWNNYFTAVDTNSCILMVPAGSYDAYRQSPGWNAFVHITEYNTFLEVTPTAFTIESQGGTTAFFTINSNTEWRLRPNAGWLSFSDTLGMNDQIVTITATNNTGNLRQAIADLVPLEKETISLFITQEGIQTNDEELMEQKSSFYYDPLQQCVVVKGLSNQILSIYSVDGRLIQSHDLNEDTGIVNVGQLPAGIYVVKSGKQAVKIMIKK